MASIVTSDGVGSGSLKTLCSQRSEPNQQWRKLLLEGRSVIWLMNLNHQEIIGRIINSANIYIISNASRNLDKLIKIYYNKIRIWHISQKFAVNCPCDASDSPLLVSPSGSLAKNAWSDELAERAQPAMGKNRSSQISLRNNI